MSQLELNERVSTYCDLGEPLIFWLKSEQLLELITSSLLAIQCVKEAKQLIRIQTAAFE